MGVFDFVKNGVREMMIARPDHLKHLIVFKHGDQNGMFCVDSVCRPGGSTPTTFPSLKNTAHSSLSTVSCDQKGMF